jgi:peptidoglycan/LPS O-acetylase OafA/YrhL
MNVAVFSLVFFVILLWGRKLNRRPVLVYSILTLGIAVYFVMQLREDPSGMFTTLTAVWLLFAVAALLGHIRFGKYKFQHSKISAPAGQRSATGLSCESQS